MLIDACMFMNETDMLELRLQELSKVVDRFIVVEALETFMGQRREMVPFDWHREKVHHVVVPKLEGTGPWERETFLRDSMLRVAVEHLGAKDDDLLMYSCCDEILRADTLCCAPLADGLHMFEQDLFYYTVNNYLMPWNGTRVGTIAALRAAGGLQAASRGVLPIIKDGGWHFSYFGGPRMIREKMSAYSHSPDFWCQEFLARDDHRMLNAIVSGEDVARRPFPRAEWRASNDPRLPHYYLQHPERFRHFTEDHFKEELACLSA